MKKLHSFDEVFDGQKVFRKVLEAMSNPGRRVFIAEQSEKMYSDGKVFLAIGMTLLDNEVTFATCGNQELAENMSLITLSKEESLENADFIFVEEESKLTEVIEKANLKQTSLYTLASRLGLNAQDYIRHFIETERRNRA